MDFTKLLHQMLNRSTGNGNLQAIWWIYLLFTLALFFDFGHGITCWHCIADNCEINPENNHRAVKRQCLDGQICQKVVFEMKSDVDETKFKSTVRSCSEDCNPQNDYLNCSMDLYTTMGCVKRACCDDDDLCNAASARLAYVGSERCT